MVVYFMVGIFGTVWFSILIRISAGAFAVAFTWLESLFKQMDVTGSTVDDFCAKSCDANDDIPKEKRAE